MAYGNRVTHTHNLQKGGARLKSCIIKTREFKKVGGVRLITSLGDDCGI